MTVCSLVWWPSVNNFTIGIVFHFLSSLWPFWKFLAKENLWCRACLVASLDFFNNLIVVFLGDFERRNEVNSMWNINPKPRLQQWELRPLPFAISVWVLNVPSGFKFCERGPSVYRPYPRRLCSKRNLNNAITFLSSLLWDEARLDTITAACQMRQTVFNSR